MSLGDAQTLGQRLEDLVIVARLAQRRACFLHGDHGGLHAAITDIVALQADGRRQHDVGHPGGRRPELLVEDHRVRLAPGPARRLRSW
jgi:hypothetical protein